MNEWLKINEHLWLFWQLNIEIVLGLITSIYVIREFYYDLAFNESKSKRRRANKHKVRVVVDSKGNTRIAEAPKDLDISIEHEGEQK